MLPRLTNLATPYWTPQFMEIPSWGDFKPCQSRVAYSNIRYLIVGLAFPVVVPPIREALGYGQPSPKTPPPVKELISKAKGQ